VENIYYKFLSNSPLSFKRVLYNELYFLSKDEINDPYDINVEKVFDGNPDKLRRLFNYIINRIDIPKEIKDTAQPDPFINYLENKCFSNHNIDIFTSIDYSAQLQLCFPDISSNKNGLCISRFAKYLLNLIEAYIPDNVYIISFTKNFKNPLMWSHYANEHKGFCLVFSSVNNSLSQDPRKIIDNIELPDSTYLSIPSSFEFYEVKYENRLSKLDGYISLPAPISGKVLSEDDRMLYWKEYKNAFLVKSKQWINEDEYRLLLDTGSPTKSGIDRLLYYDITQLIGIIFGSKMSESDKNDLIHIIHRQRSELIRNIDGILPVFCFFESRLDHINYNIYLHPFLCLGFDNIKEKPSQYQNLISKYNDIMTLTKDSMKCKNANYLTNIKYFNLKA